MTLEDDHERLRMCISVGCDFAGRVSFDMLVEAVKARRFTVASCVYQRERGERSYEVVLLERR